MNKEYQESFDEIKEHIMSKNHWWHSVDRDKYLKTLEEAVCKANKYDVLISILEEYNVTDSNIRKILVAGNMAQSWRDKANKYNEKETPKKVKVVKEIDKVVGNIESYRCPTCSYHELFIKFTDINMVGKYKSNYCEVCGQKLDWSDE